MRTETGPKTVRLADYEAPAYWVDTVHLRVQIEDASTWVEAQLLMRPNNNVPAQPIRLQGADLDVEQIRIDGELITARNWDNETLILPAVQRDSFVVETRVKIDPINSTSLEGLYRSGGMYCTQCEAEGFRKITLYPDRPDVLSVFTTRIEAPKRYTELLSNGNLVASGELDNERHFAEWHDPFPKPSYLFALVAGDLVYAQDSFETRSGRMVDLRLFVEPHNRHKTDFALGALKRAMRWESAARCWGRTF
ncbi:MAG: aminopeptidase N, partial [Natronospirillum sp.]